MKILIAFTLLGAGFYFIFPYLAVAFQVFFFGHIIDLAISNH